MKKNKPRIHITVNTVRALPPSLPNKKVFDWDDEVRGFGCYRTSGGVVVFVYQYRLPHQPARRAKIGEYGDLTPNQARDIARGMAVERRRGVDPVERRREDARERAAARDLRFATYVDAYLQRRIVEGRPVNQQHSRILVNDVAGLMPNIRIDRLTVSDIDRWQEELQRRSKSARIYGLVYLKVVLNDAKSRGLISSSPADAYKVPPQVERERFLSREELTRMLEALHDMRDMHADVLECLLRTLRRKEEIAALPWKEIDQRTWTWTLPAKRSKTGTTYVMDLPPQVVAILERQQPDPAKRTGWVFTFNGTRSIVTGSQAKDTFDANIQRRIELATANGQPQLEMEQWNFHDFRTTGGTHMGDDPLNLRDDIIELCLAHKAPREKRSKYQRAEKRRAVSAAFVAWNDFLDDAYETSLREAAMIAVPHVARAFTFINWSASMPNDAIQATLEALMPDTDWRRRLDQLEKLPGESVAEARKRILVSSINAAIERVGGFDYVMETPVLFPTKDRTFYSLIYATRSTKGIEVFRDCQQAALKEQDKVRAGLKVAKRDDLFGTSDLFGASVTGNEFAGRWIADQEAAAREALLAAVPAAPATITYGEVWPPILAEHGVRKTRLGRIAAELKAEGRIRFLDWAARKQVPDDGYRISR